MVKPNTESFNEFEESKNLLDSFLWTNMRSDSNYKSIWSIVKIILVLFHGQATVERGFSESKMLLVENLDMESLIAQRLICHNMKRKNIEPHNFPVYKNVISSVKFAGQKYQQSLVDKSKLNLNKEKSEKEMNIISEIQEINIKVASLEKTINELKNEAEKMNDLTILSKSNALKRAAIDKEITLGELKSKKIKLLELKERI